MPKKRFKNEEKKGGMRVRTGQAVVVSIPREGVEKIFNSQKEAAAYLNVDRFHVWQELNSFRGGSKTLNRRGVLVMAYEDYKGLTPIRCHQIKSIDPKRMRRKQRVHMLDLYTHEILDTFNSLREAADDLGVAYATSISRCCQGLAKSAHGYKWEYATE